MTDAHDELGLAGPPEWWLQQQAIKQEEMRIRDAKTGQYIKNPKPVKKPKK